MNGGRVGRGTGAKSFGLAQKASGRNALSGSMKTGPQATIPGPNECYQQITGQRNGCYKQDLSYKIHQPNSVSQFKASFPNKRTWGECALTCNEDEDCTFWTWASTSCSNCVRGVCNIFSGSPEEPNIEEEEDSRGHISGSRECVDLPLPRDPFLDQLHLEESKVRSALTDMTEFPVGYCHSTWCPAQEVPGFRYLGNDPQSMWVGHTQTKLSK